MNKHEYGGNINMKKLLRETIRRILLENQQQYGELAKLIITAEKESIVRAIESAEAMRYVSFTNHSTRKWRAGIWNAWSCNGCDPQFLEELEKQYRERYSDHPVHFRIDFYPEDRMITISLGEYAQ